MGRLSDRVLILEKKKAIAGKKGADGEATGNLDGGFPDSVYGGVTPIDGGTP